VVWAGTDDGNLQVSRDGGTTFTEVGKNITGLPSGALSGDNPFWISRIETSHFDAGTAYVAVDGHRSDDLHPYVFVTRDYGKTFRSVAGDLPEFGDVQAIREDPKNKDLLYAGTEFGLYLSVDAGAHWTKAGGGFPTVRTDDILIHPRDGDLIVATHGRGVWIADDVTSLQQLASTANADAYLFDVRPAVAYRRDLQANRCRPGLPCTGQRLFAAENAPAGTAISYYLKAPATGGATISISDVAGRMVCTMTAPAAAGINRVQWTLAASGSCNRPADTSEAAPGGYSVKLTVNGRDYTKVVEVLEDRWLEQR
jgi:hypothetical protein